MKRILLFGMLAGLLTASTGCGLFNSISGCGPCGPYGSRYGCGPAACGDVCDDGCGPTCGRVGCRARRAVVADCGDECDPCGVPCGRCSRPRCVGGDPCADPCGSGCYGRVWHRGPLSCLFALFSPNTWCGPSCGRRYWGDFYSDPPDCSDPCDGYGNYAGSGMGGGCRTCGHGRTYSGAEMVGGDYDDGMVMSGGSELRPQSDRKVTPAPRPLNGTPHRAVKPPTMQE